MPNALSSVIAVKFTAGFAPKLHATNRKGLVLRLVTHDAIYSERSFSCVQTDGVMLGTDGTGATYKADARAQRLRDGWPRLAHPINYTFGGASDRLVPLSQKFGKNGKVLYRERRGPRAWVNVDNVGWRVLGKISLEGAPRTGQDAAARIQARDRSAENITRKRKGCDVSTSRPPVSVEVDFRTLTPDKNPIGRSRMSEQILSCFKGEALRSQTCPMPD
jgi:hypothetical protein